MKLLLRIALLVAIGCSTRSESSPAPSKPARQQAQTFTCVDSLPRADGSTMAGAQCRIASEYCFEASGGAPVSHGAICRPLPKPEAGCADLIAIHGAGASCSGTKSTGLRVQFAFP